MTADSSLKSSQHGTTSAVSASCVQRKRRLSCVMRTRSCSLCSTSGRPSRATCSLSSLTSGALGPPSCRAGNVRSSGNASSSVLRQNTTGDSWVRLDRVDGMLTSVDAFAVWKAAYRAKMAKKPYRARRRLQGSPGLEAEPRVPERQTASRYKYGSRSPLQADAARERQHERVLPGADYRDETTHRATPARPHNRPSMPNLDRARLSDARQPRRSLPAPAGASGSGTSSRTGSPERLRGPTSVASEPAYSRLRSELASKDRERDRVVSDETRPRLGRRVGSGSSGGEPGVGSGVGAGITSADLAGRRRGSVGGGSPTDGMSELVRALRYGRG